MSATLEAEVEGTDLRRLVAHAVEPAPIDHRRPEIVGHLEVEEPGDARHLALEIGEQVAVVHEEDEGLVSEGPPPVEVPDRGAPRQPLVEQVVEVAPMT